MFPLVIDADESTFFPDRPKGAVVRETTGILENYDNRHDAGSVQIRLASGTVANYRLGASFSIDGVTIDCDSPPKGTSTPTPGTCAKWPKTVALGATRVTAFTWTSLDRNTGKMVRATDRLATTGPPLVLPPYRLPTARDRMQLRRAIEATTGGRIVSPIRPGSIAIVGNYASVNSPGRFAGRTFLATHLSGTWEIVSFGGGAYNAGDLLHYAPKMGLATAEALFQRARVGE